MSVENVMLFFQRVNDDQQLQEKVHGLGADNWENMLAGLTRLGADMGIPFSAEDFDLFQRGLLASFQESGELDDAMLEVVAGGQGSISPSVIGGYSLVMEASTGQCVQAASQNNTP
jgi:hypothetical protein